MNGIRLLRTLNSAETSPEYLPVETKTFLTHALILGMTGSGKTGLAIALLEELIRQDLPILILDPKGDLSNLFLPFDSEAASFFGLDDGAKAEWGKALEADGIDAATYAAYRDKLQLELWTPGEESGRPLALWTALSPDLAAGLSEEDKKELCEKKASALLKLLGREEERERVFIAQLLYTRWERGEQLRLEELIPALITPGFDTMGVMPLEGFFPEKDRRALAVEFNSYLMSSAARRCLKGGELDLRSLFATAGSGRSKCVIVSLRSLEERERHAYVEMILAELLRYVRQAEGSDTLRGLFYMDEIYSYFPPVALTAAKASLLSLLKQARASGISMVLASQNPADLDYRGFSNVGAFFIARLNTERDREKVLQLLDASQAAGGSSADLGRDIAGLQAREFLFLDLRGRRTEKGRSRQTMSYLAGPMSLEKMQTLGFFEGNGGATGSPLSEVSARGAEQQERTVSAEGSGEVPAAPAVAAEVTEAEAPARTASEEDTPTEGEAAVAAPAPASPLLTTPSELPYAVYFDNREAEGDGSYHPSLYVKARLRLEDRRLAEPYTQVLEAAYPLENGVQVLKPEKALDDVPCADDLEEQPKVKASFLPLSKSFLAKSLMSKLETQLKDYLSAETDVLLYAVPALKLYSKAEESREDFADRVRAFVEEQIAEEEEKLNQRYDKKLQTLDQRLSRAGAQAEKAQMRVGRERLNTGLQSGAAILDLILGRRGTSIGRASSAGRSLARGRERAREAEMYNEQLEDLEAQRTALEQEAEAARAALREEWEEKIAMEELRLKPKKTGISFELFTFYWRS